MEKIQETVILSRLGDSATRKRSGVSKDPEDAVITIQIKCSFTSSL